MVCCPTQARSWSILGRPGFSTYRPAKGGHNSFYRLQNAFLEPFSSPTYATEVEEARERAKCLPLARPVLGGVPALSCDGLDTGRRISCITTRDTWHHQLVDDRCVCTQMGISNAFRDLTPLCCPTSEPNRHALSAASAQCK